MSRSLVRLSQVAFFAALSLFGIYSFAAHASHPAFEYETSLSFVESGTYDVQQYSLHARGTFQNQHSIKLGARQFNRTFKDGTEFREATVDVSPTFVVGTHFYLESDFSFANDAEILPRKSYAIVPRYSFDASDFGFGLGYREYARIEAGFVNPNITFYLSEIFKFGFGSFITRTDETLLSFNTFAERVLFVRHRIRGDVSGGSTLEDAGLSARYTSLALQYAYTWRSLTAAIVGGKYWSDVRYEDSITLRLEYK